MKRETTKLTQVHLQFITKPSPGEEEFLIVWLCLTFGGGTKCDKSKDGEKDQRREFENETEDILPTPSGSMDRDEAQDKPKGWDADSVCNVCLPIELLLQKFYFESPLVEAKHGKKPPSENSSKVASPGKQEARTALEKESHCEAGLEVRSVEAEASHFFKEQRIQSS